MHINLVFSLLGLLYPFITNREELNFAGLKANIEMHEPSNIFIGVWELGSSISVL